MDEAGLRSVIPLAPWSISCTFHTRTVPSLDLDTIRCPSAENVKQTTSLLKGPAGKLRRVELRYGRRGWGEWEG